MQIQPLEARIHHRYADGKFIVQFIFDKSYELEACSDPLLARQLPPSVKEGDLKTVFLKSPTASMTLFKGHGGMHAHLAPLFLYNKEGSDSALVVVTKPDIPPFHLGWLVFDYLDGIFMVHAGDGTIYVNKHAPSKASKLDYPVVSDLSLLLQFICGSITETDLLAKKTTYKQSEPLRVTAGGGDTNETKRTETPEHKADKRVRYVAHKLLNEIVDSLKGVKLRMLQPGFRKDSFHEALANAKSFLDRYKLPKLEENDSSKVTQLETKSNSNNVA